MQLNVKDVLENNFNLTDYNITIPTFNIFKLFPNLDPTTLENYNVTSIDGEENLSLRDLLDGDLTLNLA